MRDYTFSQNGFTFHRIDKKHARRAYNNGLKVVFCPCNLRPGYPYSPESVVSNISGDEFESAVNSFEYYNCINTETGKYTAFYIPVKQVDRFTGETPTAKTIGTIWEYDQEFLRA